MKQTGFKTTKGVIRLSALLLAMCLCFIVSPKANAVNGGLIGANIQDGVLKGYYGEGGEIVIPNTVTQIAPEAFKGNDNVTSVTIPGSVSEIGYDAFQECSALESVYFSDPKDGADLRIRVSAFIDCPALKEITIPACAVYVTANVFKGCSSLEAIKVDADNPYYFTDDCGVLFGPWVDEGEPQYDDPNLALIAYPCGRAAGSYTIPETVHGKTVDRVWASGFRTAKNLTGITIPATCTILGGNAFEGTGLTEVTIPETVTQISTGIFENCTELTDVTLPSSVTELGMSFFDGCTSLQRVHFSSARTLTSIGIYAFRGCTSLTSIVLPTGINSITLAAFEDCSNLQRVFIPDTVISFPSVEDDMLDPFSGCASNLIVYVVSGSSGERWAYNNASTFGWTYQIVSGVNELADLDAGEFSLIDMGNKVKATGAFHVGDTLQVEPVTSGSQYDAFKAAAPDGAIAVYKLSMKPDTATAPDSFTLGIGRPAGMTSNAKLYQLANGAVTLMNSTTVSGTLTATASSLGYYAVIDGTVSGGSAGSTEATSVSLSKSEASLEMGKMLQLSATVLPATATDKTVTWTTSDATVATVSNRGVVTGLRAGTATIQATTVNGKSASCTVTVTGGQVTPPSSGGISADLAALRAKSATTADGKATFDLSLTNASRIATIQIAFETDGSAVSITGQNGFTQLGEIQGKLENGKYAGTAVLCYLNGSESFLTNAAETTVAQFAVTGTHPTVKITSMQISGWDSGNTVAYGTISGGLNPDEATFTGEKNYDLNGDGTVDQLDITWAQMYYRAASGDVIWSIAKACDFNEDLIIDVADFIEIMLHFNP